MNKPMASHPSFPAGSALEFLQHVWELNHALEKLSSQMERTLGVTAQQRLILRCIGAYPGIAPGRLATLLHLDPGTISATLSRLEKKAFLVRRPDQADRRRVSLVLTAKGRRLDRPARGTVEIGVEQLLRAAKPKEVETTRRVFAQLTLALQAELEAGQRPRARRA